MSNQKKPRNKAYRPRNIQADPISWAIAGVHTFPIKTRQELVEQVDIAFEILRCGDAGRDDWNMIVQALNVAEALATAERGSIGLNLMPKFDRAQGAMMAIAMRMQGSDKSCKAPELAAITEAIAMYRIQLRLCSQAEFGRALAKTKEMHKCGAMNDVAHVYAGMSEKINQLEL